MSPLSHPVSSECTSCAVKSDMKQWENRTDWHDGETGRRRSTDGFGTYVHTAPAWRCCSCGCCLSWCVLWSGGRRTLRTPPGQEKVRRRINRGTFQCLLLEETKVGDWFLCIGQSTAKAVAPSLSCRSLLLEHCPLIGCCVTNCCWRLLCLKFYSYY